MKRLIPLLLALLLLAACGGKEEQAPDREPSSSRSQREMVSGGGSLPDQDPQGDPSEELLAIAVDFAESFTRPFSSPEELNVARFCLLKFYNTDPQVTFEDGFYWVSPDRLEEEVRLRFDLPDYRFQSPEQENVYPRYVEEKGAIAFDPAGSGNWLTAVLAGQSVEGEYYDYTFHLYDAVITDENPEPSLQRTLRYRFRVTGTPDGRPFLQGVSAVELELEPQPDPAADPPEQTPPQTDDPLDEAALTEHARALTEHIAFTVFESKEVRNGERPPREEDMDLFTIGASYYRDRQEYWYHDVAARDEDFCYHFPEDRIKSMVYEVFGFENWLLEKDEDPHAYPLSYDAGEREFYGGLEFGFGTFMECDFKDIVVDTQNMRVTVDYDLYTTSLFPNQEKIGGAVTDYSIRFLEDGSPYLRYEGTVITPSQE